MFFSIIFRIRILLRIISLKGFLHIFEKFVKRYLSFDIYIMILQTNLYLTLMCKKSSISEWPLILEKLENTRIYLKKKWYLIILEILKIWVFFQYTVQGTKDIRPYLLKTIIFTDWFRSVSVFKVYF